MRLAECHSDRKHYCKGFCRSCYALQYQRSVNGRETSRRFTAKRQRWLNDRKDSPCMDCGGIFPPECMDFDHRDSETKLNNVGEIKNWAPENVLREIAKCDLVCANCHRIRTKARKGRKCLRK